MIRQAMEWFDHAGPWATVAVLALMALVITACDYGRSRR